MKTKMKNKRRFNRFIFFLTLALTLFAGSGILSQSIVANAATATYENKEKIPGQSATSNFVEYLGNLYKFGIAIVGILAIFMISFGAFVYIVTSAGNASKMADAKDMIFSAIIGLILAMTAYLLLYLINPDLVKGTVMKFTKEGVTTKTVKGQTVTTSTKYDSYNKACPESKQADSTKAKEPIDYKTDEKKTIVSTCDQYNDLFKEYGSQLDSSGYKGACILKVIADIESKCVPEAQNGGSCGMMQLSTTTAQVDCDQLKKDPKLSIQKAAEYIKKEMNGSCVSEAKDKLAAIFAGYNSGYGCGSAACSSTKASLCKSSDCPNALAFECCIKPGGLEEAIAYAWNGMRLYNHCVGTLK